MLTCFLLYCLLTPRSSPDTSRVPDKFIHGGLLCKQTQADVQSAVCKKRGGTPKLETEIRNWIEPLRLLSSLDITSPHFSFLDLSSPPYFTLLLLFLPRSSVTLLFFHLVLLSLLPSPFSPPPPSFSSRFSICPAAQSCSSKPDYICHTVSWGPPIRANRS